MSSFTSLLRAPLEAPNFGLPITRCSPNTFRTGSSTVDFAQLGFPTIRGTLASLHGPPQITLRSAAANLSLSIWGLFSKKSEASDHHKQPSCPQLHVPLLSLSTKAHGVSLSSAAAFLASSMSRASLMNSLRAML